MYRLLIVDDEEIECEGLRMLIECGGFPFQTETASNAEDAYDLFREKAYDLLITDIQMGQTSGLVLCEKAKELYPDLITVIISAYSEFDYAKEAIRLRVDDYLLKPISPEKFNSAIQKICDQLDCRRKKNQLIKTYAGADLPRKEQILDALFELEHSENNSLGMHSSVSQCVIRLIEENYERDISL